MSTNTKRPMGPTYEDTECLSLMLKDLKPEIQSFCLYMLSEWAYAAGFAKGMIEMQELLNGNKRENE